MGEFKKYLRTNVAEMMEYEPGSMLSDKVSISQADRENGSPKAGDMIARNPENHEDQWLVAGDYFKANFKELRPTETYMDRLIIERDELQEKCVKLRSAIDERKIPEDAIPILLRQYNVMAEYLYILHNRIEGKDLVKGNSEVIFEKTMKKGLAVDLQQLKASQPSRERSLSITKLQEAIMWLGMDLKRLNEENPYPDSYNPNNDRIAPTADGLKM